MATNIIPGNLTLEQVAALFPELPEQWSHMARQVELIAQSSPLENWEFWEDTVDSPRGFSGFCCSTRDQHAGIIYLKSATPEVGSCRVNLHFPRPGRYHLRDWTTGRLLAGCTDFELKHGIELSVAATQTSGFILTLED